MSKLGCNCGKKKVIGMTSEAIADELKRQELEKRVNTETARAASGEHVSSR